MNALDQKALTTAFTKLGKKHPFLKLAYLHGSFAIGKSTPLSDVDIALLVDQNQSQKSQWDFEIEIENILENQFKGFNFDVRVMNNAPLDFQGKVITDGVLLYATDDFFRADFEEKTRKLYFDFLPFIEAYCSERLRTIQEKGLSHKGVGRHQGRS